MKRIKRIWERVPDWNNLLLAHKKARRGKRRREEVVRFEFNRERELLQLQAQLRERRYRPGGYRQFTIYDRKARTISAAPSRDRVVHHALMNIVEPMLDRRFIPDCYACRKGRGVHAAANRYQQYARRYAYAVKLDVVNYFASIDHLRLRQKLAAVIADEGVLWLFDVIIASAPKQLASGPFGDGEDLVDLMGRQNGLPIGNLTSQFLGNLYLDAVDHYLKEVRQVPAYFRYVDDIFLLSDDKNQLRDTVLALAEKLREERLVLHPHRQHIVPTHCGLDVLGYRIWPYRRRLRAENGYRFRRRLRRMAQAYRAGRIELEQVSASVASWVGHVQHADSLGLRRSVLGKVVFSRGTAT